MTFTLRDNQTRTIRAVHERFRQGCRKVIACAPTGMGKRVLAVWWCAQAQQQGRCVLFVTNRRLLVEQMFRQTDAFGVSYGVIMAGTDAVDPGATVQIASLQTLRSRYFKDRWGTPTPERMPPADMLLIDEAHQDVDGYEELFAYYPQAKKILFTATPVDGDGKLLKADALVEEVRNTELIADGFLLPTRVFAPNEPDLKGVKLETISQTRLGKKVQQCTVFADVFNEWAPFADRPTICFCPGVAYARNLVEQFDHRLGQGRAQLVCAETPTEERERIFDEVRKGHGRVVVSINILAEGFDMPEASCGIDLQPNSQLRTYWQKVGRIKRPHPGQEMAVWLDFSGNYWRFIHPNEDPDWGLEENQTTTERTEKNRETGKEPKPIRCHKCSCVREKGARCPECGHICTAECGGEVRVIRWGEGRLREISAEVKKKREKSDAEKKLSKWTGLLFGGLRANRSLHACATLYHKDTGEWPREGWPGVYPKDSMRWKRDVKEVFDTKSLAIQTSLVQRSMK